MSDQDRISPDNISAISSSQVMRIKKNAKKTKKRFYLIQYQILQTNIMTIVWQTVRRITIKIWESKGKVCVVCTESFKLDLMCAALQ